MNSRAKMLQQLDTKRCDRELKVLQRLNAIKIEIDKREKEATKLVTELLKIRERGNRKWRN